MVSPGRCGAQCRVASIELARDGIDIDEVSVDGTACRSTAKNATPRSQSRPPGRANHARYFARALSGACKSG
jgi:hypothetical protein